jgi:hypothetical protein
MIKVTFKPDGVIYNSHTGAPMSKVQVRNLQASFISSLTEECLAEERRLLENVRLALEAFHQPVPEDKEASARYLAAALGELTRFCGLR